MEINALTVIQLIVLAAGWYFLFTEAARFIARRSLRNDRKGNNR